MIEKFSDYESVGFIDKEGEFEFTIEKYELKDSKNSEYPLCVFEVTSEAGKATIYHSLNPKARWSYNNLIAACLKLSDKQKKELELDYETFGNSLVGHNFIGLVEAQSYEKEVKIMLDDGTFETRMEDRTTYKIVQYKPCK